jgi:putative ABC transport system ATP-binding protein
VTGTVEAGRSGLDLRLRGVVHLYPSPEGDVVALRGVDLDVAAGESVSLLGPSGAGKSTVLGLLAGNFVASAGEVLIGSEDVGRMGGDRLSRLRALDVSLVVQGAERNLLP